MSDSPFAADVQTAAAVLMVRPHRFSWNEQTAASNTFQVAPDASKEVVAAQADAEFAGLQALLVAAGISVRVFDDPGEPHTPDAVFPNNWFSTHPDGTLVLYPMAAPNRRAERRPGWIAALQAELGATRLLDLSPHEDAGRFLEGTGSLVLDRRERVAYGALSSRTHPQVAAEFAAALGYRLRLFATQPQRGQPVYHTNVLLSLGTTAAVICVSAIADERERQAITAELVESGRELVVIDPDQLGEFAGNVLALRNRHGQRFWVMSSRAHAAFSPAQRQQLARHGELLHTSLSTLEALGGGSARCMLAELFPRPTPSPGE